VVASGSAASGPTRKLTPRKSLRRNVARLYKHITPQFVTERGRGWVSSRGTRTVLLRRGAEAPIRGIYLRGACDVPSLFTLAPMVINQLEGSLCIHSSGQGVSGSRSDLLLQTYEGVPEEFAEEVNISSAPRTFNPRSSNSIHGEGSRELGRASEDRGGPQRPADLSRVIYRHVNWTPCGPRRRLAQQQRGCRLKDLSFVGWFNDHLNVSVISPSRGSLRTTDA
jgi:hypothetical protein